MNLAEQIEICCLMEATARKPGNVHPAASFTDLSYDDFVRAAAATAEPLAEASRVGVGRAVFNAIEATRRETGTNVNLGIVLLIAPLAAVPAGLSLREGIRKVLIGTTIEDAEHVYAAIRLAQPGGLGEVPLQDVADRPTFTLRDTMLLAAFRDRIAEQYVTDFDFVLNKSLPVFCRVFEHFTEAISKATRRDSSADAAMHPWEMAILNLQLRILAADLDSLIVRKCGLEIATEVQQRAKRSRKSGPPDSTSASDALQDFDLWLRADGHRRNPGTTADLIAATLFAAVRDGLIEPPSRDDILRHAARIRQTPAGRNPS